MQAPTSQRVQKIENAARRGFQKKIENGLKTTERERREGSGEEGEEEEEDIKRERERERETRDSGKEAVIWYAALVPLRSSFALVQLHAG